MFHVMLLSEVWSLSFLWDLREGLRRLVADENLEAFRDGSWGLISVNIRYYVSMMR